MKGPSWETIRAMEQARWLKFAAEHQHDTYTCAAVVAAGFVTPEQARTLAELARVNGWTLPRAGRPHR